MGGHRGGWWLSRLHGLASFNVSLLPLAEVSGLYHDM